MIKNNIKDLNEQFKLLDQFTYDVHRLFGVHVSKHEVDLTRCRSGYTITCTSNFRSPLNPLRYVNRIIQASYNKNMNLTSITNYISFTPRYEK